MSHATAERRYIAQPARSVAGELTVPGDKSISHRALMLGGIAEGQTSISGFLPSADCLATLTALRSLGVFISRPTETQVRVHGVGRHGLRAAERALDLGNAGTAIRLLMGLLAGQRFDSTLIGDDPALSAALEASNAAGLPRIAVSAQQGKFLSLLAGAIQARRILEIGTLGGFSTIWLARGAGPEGRVVTLEYDPKHAEVARANLQRAGVGERVQVVVGAALGEIS